jgi:hypothetical protein
VTFPDPSGGTGDAAGNIDGILWQYRAQLPVLGLAHPYEDVDFTSEQAARMEPEVQFLLERESEKLSRAEVRRGMVRRGLLRLREWRGGVLHSIFVPVLPPVRIACVRQVLAFRPPDGPFDDDDIQGA